jgi:Asp-tRNA(Asn)/Glu-tRNA(Gln) amidotransferase C subunit
MTDKESKEAAKLARLAEMRKNLEDYASDLRAFIERLRQKLNGMDTKH